MYIYTGSSSPLSKVAYHRTKVNLPLSLTPPFWIYKSYFFSFQFHHERQKTESSQINFSSWQWKKWWKRNNVQYTLIPSLQGMSKTHSPAFLASSFTSQINLFVFVCLFVCLCVFRCYSITIISEDLIINFREWFDVSGHQQFWDYSDILCQCFLSTLYTTIWLINKWESLSLPTYVLWSQESLHFSKVISSFH